MSNKVIEAGGLKLLIKTMKNGTPTARALAAGTLGKLAIDIDLLVKIASRGNLPPLVRCLCPMHTNPLAGPLKQYSPIFSPESFQPCA